MSKQSQLFSEFPAVSKQEFEAQINKDLKGKDYEQTLVQANYENIKIAPYYLEEDEQKLNHTQTLPGNYPYVRGNKTHGNYWEIRQDIKVQNTREANNKALEALMKGADSIAFEVTDTKESDKLIKELLQDILLEHISLNFISGNNSLNVLKELINEVISRKIEKTLVKGAVNFDPLGDLLVTGNWAESEKLAMEDCASIINLLNDHLPFYRGINISGNHYHNAGASIVQELAFSLAQAHFYLWNLKEKGIKTDDITSHIQFTFSAGSNYLMEIAKFRAARMLWARIVEQYQPEHTCSMATFIHATTSEWNQTIFDPYVNMLRGTTEAMSAAIGGADSLTVTPFDSAYKPSDEFSERIARNTQIILAEESYLNKVADPSGGSYHIEVLTDSITKAAWELFQQTEAKGGFIEALKQNFIQDEIEKIADLKKEAVKSGKIVLLGTNKHPNLKEKMSDKIEKDLETKIPENTFIKPLRIFRAAEELEKKRLEEVMSDKL